MEGLQGWFDVFLLDCKARGLRPRTLRYYQETFRAFLRHVGDKDPGDLGVNDLRRFLVALQEQGISPGGVAAIWRGVRAFLKWLWREGVIREDLTARVKTPKVPRVDLPVVTPSEMRKLLAAAEAGKNPLRDRLLLLLLYDLGLRAREVVGLRLSDIGPGHIRIVGKGGHVRKLPLSPIVRRALQAYLQMERPDTDSDAVFLGRDGKPLSYEGLRSILARLSKMAKVPRKGAHAFRRACATQMLKAGASPSVVQAILGHTDFRMTAHYVRLSERDVAEGHGAASPAVWLFRGD